MQRLRSIGAGLVLSLFLMPGFAESGPVQLKLVPVSPHRIGCVFSPDCKGQVKDSGRFYPLLPGHEGLEWLLTRTVPGLFPSPAAGKTGYVYRVDFREARAAADQACVANLMLDFGPVVRASHDGVAGDVFVIAPDDPGWVDLVRAEQVGRIVTVTFAGRGVCAGQSSRLFGLISDRAPRNAAARSALTGGGNVSVGARVPAGQ